MIRNLVEYIQEGSSEDYKLLTSLLHLKTDTPKISVTKLVHIVNKVISSNIPDSSEKVIKLIFNQARICAGAPESINLENKIIISIAIRLLAEKYMISMINSPELITDIKSNQTRELYILFISKFGYDTPSISLLDKVTLMTPETIHLNSFMYEPILDMSDWHLINLYNELSTKVGGNWIQEL